MSEENPKSKTKSEKDKDKDKDKDHQDGKEGKEKKDKKCKDGEKKEKKEKKDKAGEGKKKEDIIRAIRNHPVLWQRPQKIKDKSKSKEEREGEEQKEESPEVTAAWAAVAAEVNVTAREAEKHWSKVASKFDDSYNDFHSGNSKSGGMECGKCKLWKSMDFYKAHLDSQRTGAAAASLSNTELELNLEGLILDEGKPLNLEAVAEVLKEIDGGSLSKGQFLHYLSNFLDSVPREKLGHCEKELLHSVAGNARVN